MRSGGSIKSGVHSIPEMHSGIIEGFNWPVGQSLLYAWAYANGRHEPHYPVPALRGWGGWGGGVENDCVMIGAWFVDWSRGRIEIY